MNILTIKTDELGQPHVFDADGHEIEVVGFVIDYNEEAKACYISLTYAMPLPRLDVTGVSLD